MHTAASSITIEAVDRFPEPEFSSLQRSVFAGIEQYSAEYASLLREEAALAAISPKQATQMIRIGAYDGEVLIGWSYGYLERNPVFYMANSGVIESHRRRGIYSALIEAVRLQAVSAGASMMRSQHSVLNTAVIIAKLRAGFIISGLSQSAHLGTMVELTLHLSAQREALYRQRTLPYCAHPASA